MLCHVAFPYQWVECINGDTCRSLIHFEGSVSDLNSNPQEWMEAMLGFSFKQWNDKDAVYFTDSNGLPARKDGAMVESSDGIVYWYKNGFISIIEGFGVVHHREHARFLAFSKKLWALGEETERYALEHSDLKTKLRLNGVVSGIDEKGAAVWDQGSHSCRLLGVTDCYGCDNFWCGG